MKFFYAIVLIFVVFISACAQQAQEPAVQPSPVVQAPPEPEAAVAVPEPVEVEEVVPETSLDEIRYVGAGGFDPSELTIITGSVVTWINNDEKPGAVLIFKDGKFFINSGRLKPEGKFELEFTETGEYDYWWNLAFGAVSGKITVE